MLHMQPAGTDLPGQTLIKRGVPNRFGAEPKQPEINIGRVISWIQSDNPTIRQEGIQTMSHVRDANVVANVLKRLGNHERASAFQISDQLYYETQVEVLLKLANMRSHAELADDIARNSDVCGLAINKLIDINTPASIKLAEKALSKNAKRFVEYSILEIPMTINGSKLTNRLKVALSAFKLMHNEEKIIALSELFQGHKQDFMVLALEREEKPFELLGPVLERIGRYYRR